MARVDRWLLWPAGARYLQGSGDCGRWEAAGGWGGSGGTCRGEAEGGVDVEAAGERGGGLWLRGFESSLHRG